MTVVRTEKQQAIAELLRRSPALTDTAVADQTGTSRNLVRRIRQRLNGGDAAPDLQQRSAPWRPALDPVFGEGGFADELEGVVEELVRLGGRLDQRLAAMEVHARGHQLGQDRHHLIRAIYALTRKLQHDLVPVGPCPFCSTGCARCTGGGWATEETVDAGALLEDIHAKRRWWRVHRVQVPM